MKRWLGFLFLFLMAAIAIWFFLRKPTPPELAFAKARAETLVSELSTNGKTEPVEWSAVRSERAGLIAAVHVQRGQVVSAGAPLLTLDTREEQAEVVKAEARVAQAKAEQDTLASGGRASDRAEIEGNLSRLQADRNAAERDRAALERLLERKAATQLELTQVQDRLARIDVDIKALRHKLEVLASPGDKAAAEARFREAQAALEYARRRVESAVIRAPRAGAVYNLPVRAGGYLNPGDLVAEIGDLHRLRIIVYVDEPDLGRLRAGLPVTVTWDALADRTWSGVIESLPTQVAPLGARQVGEVRTLVDNPGLDLPAGANINARIRTAVVQNALTIPKEAIRRVDSDFGVYVLEGDRLAWRKISLGISNVTSTQVTAGLQEGAAVALASDFALKPGLAVTPVWR